MKFTFEADGSRDSVAIQLAAQMKSAARDNQSAWPVISVVRDHVYQAIAAVPKKDGDTVTVMIDIDVAVSVERAAVPAETVAAS